VAGLWTVEESEELLKHWGPKSSSSKVSWGPTKARVLSLLRGCPMPQPQVPGPETGAV
jgi:hypothetical protein